MPINLGAKKQVNYLEFDGVDDYVNFGNTFNSFDFEFELELEFLNPNINERIFSKGDAANTQRQFILLITNTNQFRFIVYGSNFSNRYEGFFTHNQNFNDLGKFTLTASFDGTNQNGLSVKINNVELSKSVSSVGSPNLQAFNTDFNLFSDFEGDGGYLNGILYSFKVKQNGMLVSQYNLTEGSGTTLTDSIGNNNGTIEGATWGFDLVDNITKIYKGEDEIKRIWLGDNKLVFGALPQYELIADVNVTANTTQIDFDNLNITKDDELRLVYTFVGDVTTTTAAYRLEVNDISNNYFNQRIRGSGNTIDASRSTSNVLSFARSNRKSAGFANIKVSNNNRFMFESQYVHFIGAESNNVENYNYNVVNTSTVTSITKLSVVSNRTNGITVGSRLQLYKVVR